MEVKEVTYYAQSLAIERKESTEKTIIAAKAMKQKALEEASVAKEMERKAKEDAKKASEKAHVAILAAAETTRQVDYIMNRAETAMAIVVDSLYQIEEFEKQEDWNNFLKKWRKWKTKNWIRWKSKD